ncbi:restriction endonuclease subunit S [Butyricicoccus intestinisimiae]|uniref:Restriction endonuclease subunit S n=1 Tax=Butyricicoccus intestinisimiae TaxID=2841509 RepID=A0ABS6EQ20_9FIRM|nr:restriction endonuclease subunit S [Butyricicoccus intestinisimiae]MBU5489605.1 restriction endonuclease subunit S [Butyricicoccus intestinisimiae]
MTEWRKRCLGEITSFMSKGIPPKYVERENENTVRVLNQKCNRNFEINYEESRLHDCSKKKVPADKMLQPGDVLINSTGTGTAGRVAQLYDVPTPTTIDGHMILLRPTEEIDSIYYGYAVKAFQPKIETLAEGSTGQTEINRKRLQEEIVISFPEEKETQERIARFLLNIDEKIKVNGKINKNLEQQAEALFKAWFLDYIPWNGSVPDSWIDGKLGDFADIKRGGSPRPIQKYLSDSGLRWLKISDVTSLQTPFVIDIKDHIIEDGLKKTVFLKEGSLILSNSATPGIPKILDVDSCIHDGWLYFPKSKFSREYLYLYFKYIRQHLVNLSNGSVFNNLKTDILKNYPTILPDKETLHRFDAIVYPMFLEMQNRTRESHKLAAMRDALLPKLMSGELDVSDIDL